jgi:hypothetical protein
MAEANGQNLILKQARLFGVYAIVLRNSYQKVVRMFQLRLLRRELASRVRSLNMICEYKSEQKYWDMRHRFVHATTKPCNYPAKFTVITKMKTMHVCGIHKNSIIAHSKRVGYSIEVSKKLLLIFLVIILPIIACDCSDDVAKNPCQIAEASK